MVIVIYLFKWKMKQHLKSIANGRLLDAPVKGYFMGPGAMRANLVTWGGARQAPQKGTRHVVPVFIPKAMVAWACRSMKSNTKVKQIKAKVKKIILQ